MITQNTFEVAHLRAAGVSLIVELPNHGTPAVAYWGKDVGELSPSALYALCQARLAPFEKDPLDSSVRPSLINLASDGWMGRPGLVGHRPDGSGWAPRLRIRSVELTSDTGIKADTVEPKPETQDSPISVISGGPAQIICHLDDEETQLAVDLTLELLPQGLARFRASCTNIDPARHYTLEELSITLPLPLEADEILDFSGRWGNERYPQRSQVKLGCHLREGRHGRAGFDSPMMMFCGSRGFSFERGQVWGLHVAHSGNHRSWIERLPSGVQVIGGGELLLPGEMVLAPHEAYDSPWIYAQTADGLDNAARAIHRWERTLTSHPGIDRPVSLNVWEAVYFNHDLDVLKRLANRASKIGIERFILDDGWFRGRRDERSSLGDWEVDPDIWPDGLHPLVNYVRDRGMQFGLWIEPEMVSTDSELARNHPEWILRARSDSLPIEQRYQQVLNLTLPEVWEYVRSRMDALITEYQIEYLKWDHNRDLVDAGNGSAGRAAVHEQTLACYRLMDRLRADHPGLEIESCSSGGGRVDLEMVQHAQRFWLSDCIDPLERQHIQRWSSQLLAPELMGTHIASEHSHTTGRVSDLSFRAATALWGHLGFELDLLSVSDEDLESLADWVAFYRDNRGFLLAGDVVRRDVADGSLWLNGVVSPGRDRALFALTSMFRSPMSPRGMISLPGLEPGRSYKVETLLIGGGPNGLFLPPWAEGIVMDGAALDIGVHTPKLMPEQSLVISVQEVSR
ncbi:alpha-galactosidase [Ancrocorticia populi]|uniref:Alpha-galactosidase n=1 Tax=Ancrocorticia populi TaxID=2175228 RepID=A0A2V1K7H5_9ACTO|nr:alpha-galactosidase [Ancrocorticia populi]